MKGVHDSEPKTSVFILSEKQISASGNASGSSPQYLSLGVVHAYVDQKLVKSNKITSIN
jgi:hypothetical protein